MSLGMENIAAHEAGLRDYANERLGALNWLNIQGNAPGKGAIFSMTMQGRTPMTSPRSSTSAASRCGQGRIAPCP